MKREVDRLKSKGTLHSTAAALGFASCGALAFAGLPAAHARSARSTDRAEQAHGSSPPVLAIVSLSDQRISIYDTSGKMSEAPVSTGAKGHETPAGIYSLLQKEVDHHSNLYDDASMPYMQRLTWSGMALHAGALPGYAASHGCVRLPFAFAKQLFQQTGLGMRVIVVRSGIVPSPVDQPALFTRAASTEASMEGPPNSSGMDLQDQLKSVAAVKLAEAQEATKREKDIRSQAAKRASDVASAAIGLKAAEANLAKAKAELEAAEHALETAGTPERKQDIKVTIAQTGARVDAAQAQLDIAKAKSKAALDAALQAEEDRKAAAADLDRAAQAAETARQNTAPVSVFISRKTQRLYIRKGKDPVFESPVTIRDPDKPMGSFVFTALTYTGTRGVMRWNVVSMYKTAANRDGTKPRRGESPAPADVAGAKAALDRIIVPQEAKDRVSEIVLPRSSLIISDEGPSIETGKDTDFIVFMSGEPQGAIANNSGNQSDRGEQQAGAATRRRNAAVRRDRGFGESVFGRSSHTVWQPRGWNGGGFPFPFFGN